MSGLPDYVDALDLALRSVTPLSRAERVALDAAGGRVLAEPILADRDLPPFNRAQMDGYALRAAEFVSGRAWPVVDTIAAGASADRVIPSGACAAIATGAPLPEELDTVIQHELSDRGDRRGEPVRFSIDSIERGHAVHWRGSDARVGVTLIASGIELSAHHLGIAAAVGKTALAVHARPRAIILTSGDEVVPAETATGALQLHQIRNSNAPLVRHLLRRFGAEPIDALHLPDDRQITVDAVRDAIARADLVVTVGGVSAGDRDHFPAAFDAAGVTRSLAGAAIQPGRPVIVGRAKSASTDGAVVVGLPGNPVSVLACACLFLWPIVRAMLSVNPALPWREVELAQAVRPNPQRRAFRPAILQADDRVVVPSWAGSGDLAHTSPTHGLVELPVRNETVEAGSRLRFLSWPTA